MAAWYLRSYEKAFLSEILQNYQVLLIAQTTEMELEDVVLVEANTIGLEEAAVFTQRSTTSMMGIAYYD